MSQCPPISVGATGFVPICLRPPGMLVVMSSHQPPPPPPPGGWPPPIGGTYAPPPGTPPIPPQTLSGSRTGGMTGLYASARTGAVGASGAANIGFASSPLAADRHPVEQKTNCWDASPYTSPLTNSQPLRSVSSRSVPGHAGLSHLIRVTSAVST